MTAPIGNDPNLPPPGAAGAAPGEAAPGRVGDWRNPNAYAVEPGQLYNVPEMGRYGLLAIPNADAGDREPNITASDLARQQRRYARAADRVAQAKYNVERKRGRGGRPARRLADALDYADAFLIDNFDFQNDLAELDEYPIRGQNNQPLPVPERLTDADMIRQRFRFFEAVTDRQVVIATQNQPPVQQRANGLARGVMNVLRSGWVRWGIPAALAAAALASIVITGGASLAVIAPYAFTGGAIGLGVGGVAGGIGGAVRARGAHRVAHSGRGTQERVDEQMADLRILQNDALREGDYATFQQLSREFVYGRAEGARRNNNRQLRRYIGAGAARGAWAGAWRGFVGGAGVGAISMGINALTGPSGGEAGGAGPNGAPGGPGGPGGSGAEGAGGLTPDQVADAKRAMAEAYMRDHGAGWRESFNEWASNYPGHDLWGRIQDSHGYSNHTMVDKFFVGDHSRQSILEYLHSQGVNVDLGGQASWHGNNLHVVGNGEHYWLNDMSANHVIVNSKGNVVGEISGHLTQPQQAALMDSIARHHYTVVPVDQMTDRLADAMPLPSPEQFAAARTEVGQMLQDFNQQYGATPAAASINPARAQAALNGVINQHVPDLSTLSPGTYPYMADELSRWTHVPEGAIVENLRRIELAMAN